VTFVRHGSVNSSTAGIDYDGVTVGERKTAKAKEGVRSGQHQL
jgi:hypothetical protein